MSIGLQRHSHPTSSTVPLPYPLGRHVNRRSPSPTPSHSSSICSQATSIDSIGDMPRINQIRPMYHSSSSIGGEVVEAEAESVESMGRMEISHRLGESSKGPQSSEEDKEGMEERSPKFPEEADEDILQESNSRFVLFPIKYREVRPAPLERQLRGGASLYFNRYGKRIKLLRPVSGLQKSLTSDMT